MADQINVEIVGTQFMGRAHSNAYRSVADFFDLLAPPVLRAACDVDVAGVHPKNSVLLIPTGLTVTCVMRLILLSWQHECHKNPSNKPPPCACLRW